MKSDTIMLVATFLTLIVVFWGMVQAEQIGYIRGMIACRVEQVKP